MHASDTELLGCLVTDIQTGASIGWVKNIVFDAQGEQVAELLVDPTSRPSKNERDEPAEGLVGRPLFDAHSRYLGEIVDLVLGSETGRLHGLMVERQSGEQAFMTAFQGLVWEDDHWVLMPERPATLRTSMVPAVPTGPAEAAPEAAEDWMVGQIATVRLTDRRGQVIIEPGQRITPGAVEQASRAGVLHLLEAEFSDGL